MRVWLGLAFCISVAGCDGFAKQPQPSETRSDLPDAPVVDMADILSPEFEAKMNADLASWYADTGNALVVVSVPSLDGRTIEEVAFDIFNRWGIGDAKTSRGLLLLVSPTERKVRIEVGCGLESVVTDERAAHVIDENILPLYRDGEMAAGTIKGARALMGTTLAHINDLEKGPRSPMCRQALKAAA